MGFAKHRSSQDFSLVGGTKPQITCNNVSGIFERIDFLWVKDTAEYGRSEAEPGLACNQDFAEGRICTKS